MEGKHPLRPPIFNFKMKLEQHLKIPFSFGEVVKDYRKVLQVDVWYDAWTINDDFEVIECKGAIRNNGSYNFHNNYDDSENELYVKINNNITNRWFSFNKDEVIKVQNENIESWEKTITDELLRVGNIKSY